LLYAKLVLFTKKVLMEQLVIVQSISVQMEKIGAELEKRDIKEVVDV